VIAAPSVADVVVIDGRYRIEAELGRGGMGVVHRGTQLALDRPVAIKRLLHSIEDDGTSVERFRRESLAASRLAHPGIVGVLDAGVFEGAPYLVMELVDGEALDDHIAGRASCPWPPPSRSRLSSATRSRARTTRGSCIAT
jgi:serine/threonine protein kinase